MSVLTGFKDLDRILEGGLQNGFLYVLAARPAMGKTGLALNMDAYNTAMLFAKLERDPDYKLNSWYASAKEETTEHLSISLGDMFKDLMLDLAV